MTTRLATPVNNERPTKKLKRSPADYFDDPSKEVRWSDIGHVLVSTEDGDVEPGWISGSVFMVFGNKQKSEAQVKSGVHQLKISVTCTEFQLFKFTIGQSLKISLRGAHIVRQTATSVPGYMPFCLSFKEGAAIKFILGGKSMENDTVVDSWQEKINKDDIQEEGGWYMSSPAKDTIGQVSSRPRESSEPAASSSAHSSPFPETPERDLRSNTHESSIAISNGDQQEEVLAMDMDVRDLDQNTIASKGKAPVHETDSDDRSTPTPIHENKKEKKPKKREMRHERLRGVLAESKESREAGPVKGPKLSKAERKRKRGLGRLAKQASPEPPKRNPALDLVAGITTEVGAYPSLETLLANTFVNVIGIVASIEGPSKTRKGDFSLTVTLVDPSKFQGGMGFKVTCFMKPGFEHILPSSEKGHVLLLRNVRTEAWRLNTNGTVYPERVKWVGYNPDTGKLYYPPDDEDRSSLGPAFSALYEPRDSEIRYFVQLGEWWRAIREEEERGMIQIAEYSRRRLEHRLIGSCNTNEFFNTTVEILRLEEAGSGQTTLFFSDYTPHPLRSNDGYYGQWAMHTSTSKFEPELLDTMKPGTYWSINNMRLKLSPSGNLEADIFGARLYELDGDEDDMYLRELLKRKEAYLKEHPQNPGHGETAESLISDLSEPGHYTIVAELLYRTKPRDTVTDLYVTDYTDNPLLASYRPEGLKRQLNGSQVTVLQISTWDGEELVRDMEIGCIYTFSDVRIKGPYERGLKGHLKFADKRITRMKVKRTDNEVVLALLRRKEEHAGLVTSDRQVNAALSEDQNGHWSPDGVSSATRSRYPDLSKSMIAEIKSAEKCPNRFRLIGRIVEFLPTDISEFAFCCSVIDKMGWIRRIPDNRNACLACEDFMQEFVKWVFKFYFKLEDENGGTLWVDGSNAAKQFFNLKPCDLKENRDASLTIKRRLQGCVGNLEEYYEGLERDEVVEKQYGPYFDLALKNFQLSSGETGFALTGCEDFEPLK